MPARKRKPPLSPYITIAQVVMPAAGYKSPTQVGCDLSDSCFLIIMLTTTDAIRIVTIIMVITISRGLPAGIASPLLGGLVRTPVEAAL